jgi:hexokinase
MEDLLVSLRALRLTLTLQDLAEVRLALLDRLREGAAHDGRELAMIPAFLSPPRPGLSGEAVALDAGGTHLRAARVRVHASGEVEILGAIHEEPLPGASGRLAATAHEFFEAHARLLARAAAPPGAAVGYCVSYPSRVLPDGDAELLRWTKEVRVAGVEGKRVGALLLEHLRAAGLAPGPLFILNDTIATLAAGARGGVDPARSVGLIVGTGTNLGAYLPVSALTKLSATDWPAASMAVNFESGAFFPPGLGPADDDVDAASEHPGAQRFEKAISGAYIGAVFTAAARRLGLHPHGAPALDSAEVSRLAVEDASSPSGRIARAVLDRAADLVAAALAATSDLLGGGDALYVSAEGTMFVRGAGFKERVASSLTALLGDVRVHVLSSKDANLTGSALAALAHREQLA